MQEERDTVREFQDAYFDYVEGITDDPPSLDDVDEKDRPEAQTWLRSMMDARGANPYSSRPSVEVLLATAAANRSSDDRSRDENLSADTHVDEQVKSLRRELLRVVDEAFTIERDAAAMGAGFSSEMVVRCRGVRLRVIPTRDEVDVDTYFSTNLPALTGIFGAFPDSQAVVIYDPSRSLAVVVEQDDVVDAIETPKGLSSPPRLRRPISDIAQVISQYVNEQVPSFDPIEKDALIPDPASIATFDPLTFVTKAVEDTAIAGGRAQVPAKKAAWSGLGDGEASAIAAIVRHALAEGVTAAEYSSALDSMVDAA